MQPQIPRAEHIQALPKLWKVVQSISILKFYLNSSVYVPFMFCALRRSYNTSWGLVQMITKKFELSELRKLAFHIEIVFTYNSVWRV